MDGRCTTLAYRPLSLDLTTILFLHPRLSTAPTLPIYTHTHTNRRLDDGGPFFYSSDFVRTTLHHFTTSRCCCCASTPHPRATTTATTTNKTFLCPFLACAPTSRSCSGTRLSSTLPLLFPSMGQGRRGAERAGFRTVKPLGGNYEKEGKKGKAVVFMT